MTENRLLNENRPLKGERGYVVFVARSSPLSVEQSDHAFNVAKEQTNEGPIATATDPTADRPPQPIIAKTCDMPLWSERASERASLA